MRRRTDRARFPRAACLALLFLLCPPAAAGPAEERPHLLSAHAGLERMSGTLRQALRAWARPGEGHAGRGDALLQRLMIDPAAPCARATFRAVIDGDGRDAIASLRAAGAEIRGRVGPVVSFEGPLGDAASFASRASVRWLDIAPRMEPELDISGPESGSDLARDTVSGYGATGAGVIVAVMDTGQDLKHRDFRHADGTTRFKAVWNMSPACKATPPPGHSTGCYYTTDQINAYLKGKGGLKYVDPPLMGGHGTHVMGTAAGNGLATRKGYPSGVYVGMAPEADLVGVQLFDSKGAFVGDLVEGLQFLGEEQARQGNPPLVVNMSLGHQFGAHDGSDSDEVAIDSFVQQGVTNGTPRIVVKSAGNEGGSGMYLTEMFGPAVQTVTVPVFDGSGRSCSAFAGAGNDQFVAMVWYPGASQIRVSITTPDNAYTFSNDTGNPYGYNGVDSPWGVIFADCPMDIYPLNGDRYCWVGVDDSGGTPPTGGTWKLKFDQIAGSSGGRYDAWMVLGQKGYCDVTWDAPSPGGTISIPGTARKAIAVGAYVTRTSWTNFKGGTVEYVTPAVPGELASFSSEGPTRDGRIKPDLAAPGMGIGSSRARTVSTKSADGKLRTLPDKQHLVLEGTSMAAPHVTGAAAQLLSLDPTLTVNEVRVLLTLNARTDGFTGGGLPTNHWGSGKLDVFAAAQDLLGPL